MHFACFLCSLIVGASCSKDHIALVQRSAKVVLAPSEQTAAECKKWCPNDRRSWATKCAFNFKPCSACGDCSTTPTPTPKPTEKAPGTKWYCAVDHSGGNTVLEKTYCLGGAQNVLGEGSSSHEQAIIPMSGSQVTAGGLTSLGGDPHTLSKTWSGGSMWWWDYHSINSMRSKCATEEAPRTIWYCAIDHSGGNNVLKKTYCLGDAQDALGEGSSSHEQAIIPMSESPVTAGGLTSVGGDPHSLSKTWNGGSMWWWDYHSINSMRSKCATEEAPMQA